jgi:hypothetical protein
MPTRLLIVSAFVVTLALVAVVQAQSFAACDADESCQYLPIAARPAAPTATRAPTATTAPTRAPGPTTTPGAGQRFGTLPPGSALPSDTACAAAVKARPENKGVNASYNATRGAQPPLPGDFLSGGDPRANSEIMARVTGNFTGTTDEILQWVACKWGVDEDMVRAQAAVESWWQQTAKGDWTTSPDHCAPGHGLGQDGRPGECPNSWGLLQFRYSAAAWPGIRDSSPYNADISYAVWRACYEGYETWLNNVERGRQYKAGDALGCMGRWFSGRWYTSAATGYIDRVQGYLDDRVWEQPNFQQP